MFGQIDIFRRILEKYCEILTKSIEKVQAKTAKRGRAVKEDDRRAS